MTDEEARDQLFRDVSRETQERLTLYHAALVKWQKAINLVAPATLAHAWHRHFLDSSQVFDAARVASGRWVDIGSGGGFPGLVCALIAAEKAPDLSFSFVESDIRKCSFLREVARQCDVPIHVFSRRIEDVPPQDAAVLSARALAPLDQLLGFADRHLAMDGVCVFQKGASHLEELESARADWQMEVEIIPSVTAADAAILRIGHIAHA